MTIIKKDIFVILNLLEQQLSFIIFVLMIMYMWYLFTDLIPNNILFSSTIHTALWPSSGKKDSQLLTGN